MAGVLHIGCCGWGYLREKDFQDQIKRGYRSKLQAYAQLYECVELNSTFYRIPKASTAEKWKQEAGEVNKQFEFTVKMSQIITHRDRFSTASVATFEQISEICCALAAKVLLFQSPASFSPTKVNISKMLKFFGTIDRSGFVLVWEPRGRWFDDPPLIDEVCRECDLVHCVDPFRNQPVYLGSKKIAYFRLHGFGKPSMYGYDFSKEELQQLLHRCREIRNEAKEIYVFFNNVFCYENGLQFAEMVG